MCAKLILEAISSFSICVLKCSRATDCCKLLICSDLKKKNEYRKFHNNKDAFISQTAIVMVFCFLFLADHYFNYIFSYNQEYPVFSHVLKYVWKVLEYFLLSYTSTYPHIGAKYCAFTVNKCDNFNFTM